MEPRPRLHVLAAATAALLALGASAHARVLLKPEEALRIAFPKAKPEVRAAVLTEEERRAAERSGRVKIDRSDWTYYVGSSSSGAARYAYFETHVVRTMPETFMAVVDGEGRLDFVELLAFHEPDDYRPPARWLEQFDGRRLGPELFVRRGVRNIAGASLTSQALTDGVRRILAVHAALRKRSP